MVIMVTTCCHHSSLYNGDDACTGFAGYVNFASDMCFPVNDGTMSLGLRCATGSSGMPSYSL